MQTLEIFSITFKLSVVYNIYPGCGGLFSKSQLLRNVFLFTKIINQGNMNNIKMLKLHTEIS